MPLTDTYNNLLNNKHDPEVQKRKVSSVALQSAQYASTNSSTEEKSTLTGTEVINFMR